MNIAVIVACAFAIGFALLYERGRRRAIVVASAARKLFEENKKLHRALEEVRKEGIALTQSGEGLISHLETAEKAFDKFAWDKHGLTDARIAIAEMRKKLEAL